MRLSGWGRYPSIECSEALPSTRSAVFQAISSGVWTPRGCGRSYGDSALGSSVLCTSRLNLFRRFENGLLTCAAGVSLADILDVFVPRGWFLHVTPGTNFVSVGGAIASDVHGKNHHRDGCFSEFVQSLTLALGDGSIISCSRDENADLFHATCGGMGLTGVILEATLRLLPIQSSKIEQTVTKAGDLEELLALFGEHENAPYSVAWIDCLATGSGMGRGLLMTGEHVSDGDLSMPARLPLSVPFNAPYCLLNGLTMRAFNTIYYAHAQGKKHSFISPYEPFFYPLDNVRNWNRLYGKRGFVQYQFVLPKAAGLEGMTNILHCISASQQGSFLAVLKLLGKANGNLLSFPTEGYSLALDFKLQNGILEMLDDLDAMVLDYGGRLYLAKDARMSAATFRKSYPNWEAFQSTRAKYKALGKFASLQSKRLGMD